MPEFARKLVEKKLKTREERMQRCKIESREALRWNAGRSMIETERREHTNVKKAVDVDKIEVNQLRFDYEQRTMHMNAKSYERAESARRASPVAMAATASVHESAADDCAAPVLTSFTVGQPPCEKTRAKAKRSNKRE